MKLLVCEKCGTITPPMQHPYPIIYRIPVRCMCGESWCWWENAEQGILKVYGEHARVLGIANNLIHFKLDYFCTRDFEIDQMIEDIPDNYLFKKFKSLIIKYKPGFTGDTILVTKEELDKQIEATNTNK